MIFDQVGNLAKDNGSATSTAHKINDFEDGVIPDDDLRKIIADLFVDNVRLRKQMNCVTRHYLKLDNNPGSDDFPLSETVTST